ncbi:MAG TPA: nucleotidyltransferase domain-containing protein [Patescibacteria group bacterium]
MTLDNDTVKKIVQYFKNKPRVEVVYLYGSQARNEARSDSDIDLAVLESTKNSDYLIYPSDLAVALHKKVDVQNLLNCPPDFSYRVLLEGKVLFSRNEKARIAFEEKTFRQYFDVKPILDEYFKSLSKIVRKGELGVRYI